MKKISLLLVLAILLGGAAFTVMATPSHAQGYQYPPPPADPYASPWVGPGTPWVYYNGDWFLNGILYYFFGPAYGWAPYYAYPPTYIVRPPDWYAPRWFSWYRGHPTYWQSFQREYPYWRSHREGERYGRQFYEQHHRGQGGGWEKGFHGRPVEKGHPEGRKPAPVRVAPETHRPAPGHVVTPQEGHRPPAGHMAPEGRKPAPARVAPPAEHRPAPGHMAPPAEHKPAPAPAHMAPQGQHAPAPRVAPQGGKGGAPAKPEGGGHGEEKH
jgi:hypothetical protein